MIILQCYKCGQCSYLNLNEKKVTEKQTICKACGKPETKVKTRVYEMPTPYLGWKKQ